MKAARDAAATPPRRRRDAAATRRRRFAAATILAQVEQQYGRLDLDNDYDDANPLHQDPSPTRGQQQQGSGFTELEL